MVIHSQTTTSGIRKMRPLMLIQKNFSRRGHWREENAAYSAPLLEQAIVLVVGDSFGLPWHLGHRNLEILGEYIHEQHVQTQIAPVKIVAFTFEGSSKTIFVHYRCKLNRDRDQIYAVELSSLCTKYLDQWCAQPVVRRHSLVYIRNFCLEITPTPPYVATNADARKPSAEMQDVK